MAEYYTTLDNDKTKLIKEILQDKTHGKKIYLIGSAEYGPTNEPVLVKSTVGLYNKFGRRGTLIDAFHSVKYTNRNTEVYLVKTTGEHASAFLNVNTYGGDIIEDGFVITAGESNEIYNEVYMLVETDSLSFVFPKEFGLPVLKYYYKDFPTIESLADAINEDTRAKKNVLYAYYTCDPGIHTRNAFFSVNATEVYLYGGQCGLNYSKDLLYNCLARTYEMLESETIDIIVPVDAFMDDIYPDDSEEQQYRYNMKYYHSTKDYLTTDMFGNQYSFMDQLIQFCIKQLNFGVVTHGILGFNTKEKLVTDYLFEADELKDMYTACMEYNLAHVQYPFYSFMVSVVAGDLRYNHGTVIDNAYLAYAAFASMVQTTSGTTNLPLSDFISLYEEFTEETLAEFAENGIVAFRHSPLYNKPVVYDGVTASKDENLRLYVNVRMIQLAISYINRLCQFHIGGNMHKLIKKGTLRADLNSILTTIKSADIINSFEFRIQPYYQQNEIRIYLTMLTNYMVKAINLCAVVHAQFDEELIE